ncbi:Zn(2)-C6 fungal-type domain-containing protein [Mycena sanguinolenta]|uniref:Zn(2)-C6 fungal-type domain-containing protein n=1 Tax=Mycena sanguinolenta TaxID=230812 RepID=A0A8H6Z6F4_9AGAR|nr:Zn(2)-C6 fungal-type domain-containing protein [Mycena sanguinolenta]
MRSRNPGACSRCRNLKVKCEYKTETDPCKRCFNGGHDCVTPGLKKRRLSSHSTLRVHKKQVPKGQIWDLPSLREISPAEHEHLLNQIREQAAEIQKLKAQVEQNNARQHVKPPNSSATHSFPLMTSSSSLSALPQPVLSPASSAPSISTDINVDPKNNRAVEDWIAKARDSLAEFDGFIGIGGTRI